MNAPEARRRITAILDAPDCRIRYSKHGGRRAQERQVPLPSIGHLLRGGCVAQAPYQDVGREEWRCALEGPDANGEMLRVIIGVHPEHPILTIVSVMRI